MLYPPVVSGDRVGTVFLEPRHREGPEPRQERVLGQLLPTVALVAKAVSLAVEADLVRQDLARQRDVERTRILGDLHDGLGPILVGVSMRVSAELHQRPTPTLEALASELAVCRAELRGIVSGLAPPVLNDGDLAAALQLLIGAFAGQGPAVSLDCMLNDRVSPEVAVAVYRSIAEGITNALRHAHADRVRVCVRTTPGGAVHVEVSDNGVGGPITPGVGLSSLRRRAEELGGSLRVAGGREHGTRLHLELPADLQLPDGDGISLGRMLKHRWPRLRVIVFTMHADDASVMRSLGSGLDGYLLKDSDPDDVLAAIHSAAHGTLVLGRGAQAAVITAATAAPQPTALSVLDSRDLEILELLVRGLSTAQVAARLFLAPKTIRNRISDMLGKLGVSTRDEAIALGRAGGLATPQNRTSDAAP